MLRLYVNIDKIKSIPNTLLTTKQIIQYSRYTLYRYNNHIKKVCV